MRRPFAAVPCTVAVLAALVWGFTGCDDEEREERRQTAQQIRRAQEDAQQAQSHAIEVERRRDQDRRVLQAQTEEARGDTSAAIGLWLASSGALVIVILALVRETRLRGVLQRLVRRTLRQQEGPP